MTTPIALRKWVLLAIVSIFIIWLHVTSNRTTTPDTPRLSHILELAGKQIPIPKREWIAAGNANEEQKLPNGNAIIASQVLFGLEHNVVTSFILANANATPNSQGWGISQDCKNSKYPFTAVFEYKDRNYKCSFVADAFVVANTTAWKQANELANKHKWRIPSQWMIVGIRVADRLDVVDVRFGFNMQELTHNNPASNLLTPKMLHNTAMQTLVDWQKAAYYWVERGFRRQLDFETQLPMPAVAMEQSASSMIATSRLHQLNKLRADGWLSEADFVIQHNLIKKSIVTQADLTVDIWHLGTLKTAGHTTQSLFWMWGVNYLFLGNVYVAGGLALAKSAISPIRYYLQEVAWNTWGPRRNPTLPVIDFL